MTITAPADLAAIAHSLRHAWHSQRPSLQQRDTDLLRLRMAVKDGMQEMALAIAADFGHRSLDESRIADGMSVLSAIDHLRRHLRRWSRPRRARTGLKLWPARAHLRPTPLGVVGVISPWNYPVTLALVPLATAIAAGNHVLLKPSEHTPRTSAWLAALVAEVFPVERVAVVQGGADVAAAVAGLPLDHLVFTGSSAVGRKVMAAAAQHLVPLTLELGGKSPAIVCADYPLDKAAARLATGKWFNAGQTCIAPDHVLVDAVRQGELVQLLQQQVQSRYADFSEASDYTRIINEGQYQRLQGYLAQARERGVTVIPLASVDAERADRERLLVPTVVLDPPADLDLMQEEIFGPILPVIGYHDLATVLERVATGDRPLALYPFSHDRIRIEQILGTVVAGGVTVNDTLLHFAAEGLPFGGVGASGMGAYHGQAGFDALSHLTPVLWQRQWAATDLLKPPYPKIAGILKLLLR